MHGNTSYDTCGYSKGACQNGPCLRPTNRSTTFELHFRQTWTDHSISGRASLMAALQVLHQLCGELVNPNQTTSPQNSLSITNLSIVNHLRPISRPLRFQTSTATQSHRHRNSSPILDFMINHNLHNFAMQVQQAIRNRPMAMAGTPHLSLTRSILHSPYLLPHCSLQIMFMGRHLRYQSRLVFPNSTSLLVHKHRRMTSMHLHGIRLRLKPRPKHAHRHMQYKYTNISRHNK